MEMDKRTVQTEDVGILAGVLLRVSNTAELFAQQLEQAKQEIVKRDKAIAELTTLNKRLIDEKNAALPVDVVQDAHPGNGTAAA